jgi:ketosteroid isomerase-like protein
VTAPIAGLPDFAARRRYSNRYISVLTIRDRKVVHWRDYLDPVAVFDAVGWPSAATEGLQ